MAVMNSDSMKPKGLSHMSKPDLVELCTKLEIEFDEKDTISMLVDRVKESGKYVSSGKESGGGQSIKNGKRVHKTLGEYKRCIVHPTEHSQQNTSIFCSIGLYTVEFQPRMEIDLPATIIAFLKESSIAQHVFDPKAISENGQVGAHITKEAPKYIVEVL